MSTELIRKAYVGLFPGRSFNFSPRLKYSAKFSNYGANVRQYFNVLEFRLSYDWKDVSDEIKMGLFQELFVKMLKPRNVKRTLYIDLYNNFIKNVHIAIPKTAIDPELSLSFDNLNDKYFNNDLEKPNLVWGQFSKRKLGSYNYKNDTIIISTVFKKIEDKRLLDYVMYHEMLHKKHKFSSNGERNRYHSTVFKKEEAMFENYSEIENLLKRKVAFARWPKSVQESRVLGFIEKLF